uniref:Uncharacterized protein n=1 Tax=Tanacetum cinerariifolium TaxID=118510 RepID=A0A6L2LUU8_TANCI|nr:hypothetical protein [Tanacetum cinerariifolium]
MPTITGRGTWLARGLLGYWLGSALGRSRSFCLDTKYTSPKVSNSSPLVSPNAPINMRRGMYNVNVAATFRVPLTAIGDLDVSRKDIEVGKHKELLSRMTNDKRKAVMDALVVMCNSIQAANTNVDAILYVVSHVDDSTIVDALAAENLNVDKDPIVHSIFIQDKPNSYIAAARGSRPKPSVAGASKLDPSISKANFHSLFLENLCEGVNVSIPRKVVETFGGHSVKQNIRYEPKATTSAPNKGATNLGNTSKSSSIKNQPPKDTITSTKEAAKPKDNTLTSSVPSQDEALLCAYGVWVKSGYAGLRIDLLCGMELLTFTKGLHPTRQLRDEYMAVTTEETFMLVHNLIRVDPKSYSFEKSGERCTIQTAFFEPADVEEVLEVVTTAKLITKVVTAGKDDVTAASVEVPIPRKRKGVIIHDPKETITTVTVQPKVDLMSITSLSKSRTLLDKLVQKSINS